MTTSIDEKMRKAKAALSHYDQHQEYLDKRKEDQRKKKQKDSLSKFFNNTFWIILLIVAIGGLGYLGYTKKDVIGSWFKTEVATVLKTPAPQAQNTISGTVATSLTTVCNPINVTDSSKSSDGKIHVSPVSIGNCYSIAEANRETWKAIFSDNDRVTAYAAQIVTESFDKSMSQPEVVNAITTSLNTFILDLRKIVPTAQSTTTPSPTAISTTPTPPVPTSVPTPAAIVVPFPEKERALDLAELALTMKSHNIPAVASNNSSTDIHDRVDWQMWYETSTGKDYLVLNVLGKNFPTNCSTATFISVTLASTGGTGEVATQAGDEQVWIICR